MDGPGKHYAVKKVRDRVSSKNLSSIHRNRGDWHCEGGRWEVAKAAKGTAFQLPDAGVLDEEGLRHSTATS